MGRRAKPIELLKRGGKTHVTKEQVRKRTEREAELRAGSNAVKPPHWLSVEALGAWKRLVPILKKAHRVTNDNVDALAVLCDAIARHAECTRELDAGGLVIVNNKGNLVPNPYATLQVKYAGVIKQYGGEFGITPATLAKLAIPHGEEKPKDQFEEDMA